MGCLASLFFAPETLVVGSLASELESSAMTCSLLLLLLFVSIF